MKQNFKRRLLAGLLTACMMLQTIGTLPVYAVGNTADSGLPIDTSSVCTHHIHDDACGYTEGTPCTFDTATCEICNPVDDEADTAEPVCICSTLCTEGVVNAECPVCSVNAADCVVTVPEQPVVEILEAVQALIDALPAAEDIANMNDSGKQAVSDAIAAIDEAMALLTAEQISTLDRTRYDAAYTALTAGEPQAALLATNAATGVFDISEGAITIENSGETQLKVSYGGGKSQLIDRTSAINLTGTAGSADASTTNLVNVTATDNVNITLDSLTIYGLTPFAIKPGATVNLTLKNSSRFESSMNGRGAGLFVPQGASLVIDGNGSLYAKGIHGGAGIGGGANTSYTPNSGSITIKGGTVDAVGYCGGAGIGAGMYISPSNEIQTGICGSISIQGGNVTGTSTTSNTDNFDSGMFKGKAGAGIGGCYFGNAGSIKIEAGTVTATGADGATGIGGGALGSGGNTTISGGNVTATGNGGAAAIGSGYNGSASGKSLSCGTIVISGGNVNATCADGTVPIGNGQKHGTAGEPSADGSISIQDFSIVNTNGVALTSPVPMGTTVASLNLTLYDGRLINGSDTYTISLGETTFPAVTATASGYSVGLSTWNYTKLTGKQTLTITDKKGNSWTQQVTVQENMTLTIGKPLYKTTLWFNDSAILSTISGVTLSVTQAGNALNQNNTAQIVNLVADQEILRDSNGIGKLVLYLPQNTATTSITVSAPGLNAGKAVTKDKQNITINSNNIVMLGSGLFTGTMNLSYGNISFSKDSNGKLQITSVPYSGAEAYTETGLSWGDEYYIVQQGGSTGNQISVSDTGDNTAHITLDGVRISSNDRNCINLQNAKAKLTLVNSNTLSGSGGSAALHVPPNASVEIAGNGTLTVSTSGKGAGIGGNNSEAGGNITISGGTVEASTAAFSTPGAAIGGGNTAACGTLTIAGGTVIANSKNSAAAIGSGSTYIKGAGQINITGGTVTATATDVSIGNTTTNRKIACKITGGSVYAGTNSNAKFTTDGTITAQQTKIRLKNADSSYAANALVTAAPVLGYGIKDMYTDGEGYLYLWLPANTTVTSITTENGTYKGSTTSGTAAEFTLSGSYFTPVKDITLPTTPRVGATILAPTVVPNNATNKTVTWSIADKGTTSASLSGSTLTTTATGTLKLTATVTNGATATTNYTKTFTITVLEPTLSLTGTLSASGTYGQALNTLTPGGGTVKASNGNTVTGTWAFKQNDATSVYPTVSGTTKYTATFTPASGIYSNTLTAQVIPTMSYSNATATATASPAPNTAGWNHSDITLTAPSSYTISAAGTMPGTWGSTISHATEGESTLTYYLKNSSGLVAQKTFAYNLDKTVPNIGTITYSVKSGLLGWLFHNNKITVTVPVTDTASGAKYISYVLTNSGTAAEAVTVNVKNGTASFDVGKAFKGSIAITAYDKAGNASAVSTVEKISVEDTKPTLTASASSGTQTEFSTNWYATAQTIYITAQDGGSGLKSVSYTVDGGAAQDLFIAASNDGNLTTEKALTISVQEGTHTYVITATDNALNTAVSVNVTIKQDSVAPSKPTLTASAETVTTATLTASGSTDAASGIKEYTLTETNSKITPQINTTGVFNLTGLTANAAYRFTVTVTDNMGNVSVASDACNFTTLKTPIKGTVNLNKTAPKFGDTITATANVTVVNAGTLAYKWYRDNAEIGSATNVSYSLVADDVGKIIKAEVTATNCSGTLMATTTDTVAANIAVPTTAGTLLTGDTVTVDKTSAKNGDTVTYTVRFADGSTPTLTLSSNTGTLSAPTKSATENKWTYTYVVTAGDSDISATATFAAKKVKSITNSTGANLFADDGNNNDAVALKAYLDSNIKVTATYDNGTTTQMAAVYTLTTGTWSAQGGNYTYTATAGEKTCDVSVNVKAITATVSAIADINKVKNATNGYPTHDAIGLPKKATITYIGDGFTTKTAELDITWTTAVPTDFGKTATVAAQAFDGAVTLPAWATGTNAVTANVNIADKTSIDDELTVSISGWTFGETAKAPTAGKKAGSTVTIDNTKFTFAYNGTANDGTALTDSATAPTKAGTYTVTANYEDETQIGSVISDSFIITRKSITPTLTVTGVTKVYDGKVTVEGIQPVIAFTGTLGGDVPAATAIYNYDTETVGTGKTINATAIALTADAVNGNYTLAKTTASAMGAEITSAEPTLTAPTNLHAITNTQKTLADVKFENHDGTGAGNWAWKAPETTLTASDIAPTQAFTAVFTPTDTVNYKAVEKDITIKVSEIVATFNSLEIKTITTDGGTADISAVITVKGELLPSAGDITLDKVVTWDNSCPEIVSVAPNNSGATYKATVTGVKKGISMVGIAVNGKPVSSVMVKYAPPSGGDSNNTAGEINSIADTITDIVNNPDRMTATEKAVVNAAATELMSLPQAAKETLSTKAIENLDDLYQKSVGLITKNDVITNGVSNPISAGGVAIKGMALASGATSAATVKVEIKQQNPMQSASGKKSELEFEMKLTVDGTVTQLQAPLLISLPLPNGINTDGLIIKHTKSSGISEEITLADTLSSGHYTLSGNTATMWVNSFSTFTIMTVDSNPGGGTGGNPGGNPAPEVYYYINATTSRGGSINTPERVKVIAGGSASFTITPDKGYQIADVLVNGNSIGAKNSYVFTNVNADQTIHATFKKAGHRNPQTGVDANVG